MLREGPADERTFAENEGVCGESFCSPSCERLGRHVLIYPRPYETYDDAVERARAEPPEVRVVAA